MKFTPEKIESLAPSEIFVYGSNQLARHDGGAALIANQKFGALHGDAPLGLIGNTYGIITTSFNEKEINIQFIAAQVRVLYEFAFLRPDLTFYVTKIGCGIAGWTIEQIAPLFYQLHHIKPFNIILPIEFHP